MSAPHRFPFATAALVATLGLSAASQVSAQQRIVGAPNRSVQAVPPAQGAATWGPQDNCSYVFQNGGWYRQDICRIMQGPSAYVTYSLSTGQRLAYYDESEPGWIKAQLLTDPNALLFAIPTVAGRNIMVMINGQWVDAATAQRVDQQQGGSGMSAGGGFTDVYQQQQIRRAQEARAEAARKAEEEAHYKKMRDDKYYREQFYRKQQIEKDRLKREAIEKDRLKREADERAVTKRDTQRELDERAAARQREQRAADATAAYERQAEQRRADQAAAERKARNR